MCFIHFAGDYYHDNQTMHPKSDQRINDEPPLFSTEPSRPPAVNQGILPDLFREIIVILRLQSFTEGEGVDLQPPPKPLNVRSKTTFLLGL